MIALDTHVVVWLYAMGAAGVSAAIAERLDGETALISPPAQLELAYLHEIGRVAVAPGVIMQHLGARLDIGAETLSAQALFDAAAPLVWTRDPFDRLICAHAGALGVDLVTKDTEIHHHFAAAVW